MANSDFHFIAASWLEQFRRYIQEVRQKMSLR